MPVDEPTLPETVAEALVRAGFSTTAEFDAQILEGLHSSEARERVLALRAAARRAIITRDQWREALMDREASVRRDALTLLAYEIIDFNEVADLVLHALDDPDPLIVDGAIFALAEHLYSDAVVRVSEIARGHDDARCRETAVAALGAFGDERGRDAVLAALDDKPAVRRRAIVALSNFEGPDIDAALARASEDRDWQVRAAVDQLTKDEPD
ncbi:MAG: HEAT repeat domain-containing protein [Acidimicrobiales bacterium]